MGYSKISGQTSYGGSSVEELLYLEIVTGGSILENSDVYSLTMNFSENQMASLRMNLQARLCKYYDELRNDGRMTADAALKSKNGIDGKIEAWIGRWPLLKGKMESKLDDILLYKDNAVLEDIVKIVKPELSAHGEMRREILNWCKSVSYAFDIPARSIRKELADYKVKQKKM